MLATMVASSILAILLACLPTGFLGLPGEEEEQPVSTWGQWRGPLGTGFSPGANPPIEWSESQNVRWKLPLPGLGHSTPVVWGERIYLTATRPVGDRFEPRFDEAEGSHNNLPVTNEHEFLVVAIERTPGKILWQKVVHSAIPFEAGHESGTLASASPVTDGEHVYAFFGSHGLYCLDTDGDVIWSKELGRMQSKHAHGEGSSPALFGDTLIVTWDHEGDSFVLALDKRTGEERWRVARDEPTSWASPIVVEHSGGAQVIVSGTTRLRAYDIADGKVIWECGGLSNNVVATPVTAAGIVVAGSSYEKQAMLAIRLEGASGDLTKGSENLLWMRRRRTPYVPSPLLYDDALYYLSHYQGVLSRVDLATGEEPHGPFRLQGVGAIYASPVGASGRIYIADRSGATVVLSHAAEPQVLALNQLDDSFSASPVLLGDELFLRGERFLYCLAEAQR
jgi:outer membrane protein assembly factor BamB